MILVYPDASGHDILKELRVWYHKPIIMLSVQNSETDIVTALDSGATDYLTKPFRTGELLARIRSSMRNNITTETQAILKIDNLQIDFVSRTVKLNNEVIKLTSTEYSLIVLFAKNEVAC